MRESRKTHHFVSRASAEHDAPHPDIAVYGIQDVESRHLGLDEACKVEVIQQPMGAAVIVVWHESDGFSQITHCAVVPTSVSSARLVYLSQARSYMSNWRNTLDAINITTDVNKRILPAVELKLGQQRRL